MRRRRSRCEAGDWLVVFTDGVVEAENNPQEEYGEIRFMTMINAGVMLSPEMMLNSIMVDLDALYRRRAAARRRYLHAAEGGVRL